MCRTTQRRRSSSEVPLAEMDPRKAFGGVSSNHHLKVLISTNCLAPRSGKGEGKRNRPSAGAAAEHEYDITCPICSSTFGAGAIEAHVIRCLDEQQSQGR